MRMLSYIKDTLHATAVGIVWAFYAASQQSDMVQSTPTGTLSAQNVAILTRIAQADGLEVEYRPLIYVTGAPARWEGRLVPTNPTIWFAEYLHVEVPYLTDAQRLGVKEVVAATEMHYLNPSARWSGFFTRVANVYHGTVSYAAWDGDYFHRRILPTNEVGMDMYKPLPLPVDASIAQVTAAWEQAFSKIPSALLRRTTIDETGIAARAGAYQNPPALWMAGTLDQKVQYSWYIAACNTIRHYHMRGVYFWKVDLADDPAHPTTALSVFEGRQGAGAISECARILG